MERITSMLSKLGLRGASSDDDRLDGGKRTSRGTPRLRRLHGIQRAHEGGRSYGSLGSMENYRVHPRDASLERDQVNAILNQSWDIGEPVAGPSHHQNRSVIGGEGGISGVDKSWQTERLKGMQMLSKSVERNKLRHSHRSSKKSRKKQQQLLQQQQQQQQQHLLQQQQQQQQQQHQQLQQQQLQQQQQHQLQHQHSRHTGCSGGLLDVPHRSRLRAHSAGDENRITELLIDLPQCKHSHHQPITGHGANNTANQMSARGRHYEPTVPHYSTSSQMDARIDELTSRLQREKHLSRKDKITVAHLQHEISRQKALTQRECLMHDFERERMLRIDAEKRLEEMTRESDSCKSRLEALTQDFQNMDDMVRGMVHYKTKTEQLKQDKANLIVNYENNIERYQGRIADLEHENMQLLMDMKTMQDKYEQSKSSKKVSPASSSTGDGMSSGSQPVQQLDMCKVLQEKIRKQEAEHSSLMLENEKQRQQYERCLDDIANQVVNALLAQKGLREECLKLQDRVKDLEHHNRQLRDMFKTTINFNSKPQRQATLGKSLTSPDSGVTSSFTNTEDGLAGVSCGGLLERKPEGQSGTIFSEESLASLHSMFSDQDPMHGDGLLSGESQLSSGVVWNSGKLSSSASHEQILDDNDTQHAECSAVVTASSMICCTSDSGLHTQSYVSSHQSLSTQSQSSINSPHRLVVSPSSTTSSHFCSVEMRVDCTGGNSYPSGGNASHPPGQFLDKVIRNGLEAHHKATPDDLSSASTVTTSPGEHLLQLSDSFPEKLMILTSPDLQSPVEEYLTFSDDSDEEVLEIPGLQSTLSLNDILEQQSGTSVTTPRDESFDSMPAYRPENQRHVNLVQSHGGLSAFQPIRDRHSHSIREHYSTHPIPSSHTHEQWAPPSPPIERQPVGKSRCCLIQRPTSLELLSNTNKLTHVFDDYLADSSSSNSDMTSSRTGQLNVQVPNDVAVHDYGRHRATTNAQSSPTTYHHLNGQRLTLADSTELNNVCRLPNKSCNKSYDGSSTSHSPQSLSPTRNTSNSQTPLSYGSPPVEYSVATASNTSSITDSVPTHVHGYGATSHQTPPTSSTISTPAINSCSSPDSAMQQSFSSSSGTSDHCDGASVEPHQATDKQCHNKDDGYASNSTTSVSLSDMQKVNMCRVNTELGQVVENGESMESSSCSMSNNGSLASQCTRVIASSTSSIESNKIGSVRDITAYFEGKFETQQIRIEPSPQIKMPPKLKPKPMIKPHETFRPHIVQRVRRSVSDSCLCVKKRENISRVQYTRWLSDGYIAMLNHGHTGDSLTCLLDMLKRDCNHLQQLFEQRPTLLMDRTCNKQKHLPNKIAPDTNWMSLSDSGSDSDDMSTDYVNDWVRPGARQLGQMYERPVVQDCTPPQKMKLGVSPLAKASSANPLAHTQSITMPYNNAYPSSTDSKLYPPSARTNPCDLLHSPLSPAQAPASHAGAISASQLLASPTNSGNVQHDLDSKRKLRKPYDHLKKEAMTYLPPSSGSPSGSPKSANRFGFVPRVSENEALSNQCLSAKKRAEMLDDLVACPSESSHNSQDHVQSSEHIHGGVANRMSNTGNGYIA